MSIGVEKARREAREEGGVAPAVKCVDQIVQYLLAWDRSGDPIDRRQAVLWAQKLEGELLGRLDAAPDMYEALEAVMRLQGYYVNEHPVIAKKVRAALQKARGET